MLLFALLIGVVLIVAAVRNSQTALFTALGEDVPAFVVWGAAIVAIGIIGFVPGLKPVSRGLLILIIVVLVMKNYRAVISGFESLWTNPPQPTDTAATAGGTVSSAGGTLPSGESLIQDYIKKYGIAPPQAAIDMFNHQNLDPSVSGFIAGHQ